MTPENTLNWINIFLYSKNTLTVEDVQAIERALKNVEFTANELHINVPYSDFSVSRRPEPYRTS